MKWFIPLFLLAASLTGEEIPHRYHQIAPTTLIPTAEQLYTAFLEAKEEQKLWDTIDLADALQKFYHENPLVEDLGYEKGVAYLELGQYELASEELTHYLSTSSRLAHFEEAVSQKFLIAEHFRNGGKLRLFGSHKLPAWIPSEGEAIKIYDEVIMTLPHHEITLRSLLGKAEVLVRLEEYRDSIEALETLLRKFPSHPLTADAYLSLSHVYLEQARHGVREPELIDLSIANIKKLSAAFPQEERIDEAKKRLSAVVDIFADDLLETAAFYDRRKKPDASSLYYQKIVSAYPNSQAALIAEEKLSSRLQQ